MEKNANKTLLLKIASVALALVIAFVIGFVRGQSAGDGSPEPETPAIEQTDGGGQGEAVEQTQPVAETDPASQSDPSPGQATNPEPEPEPELQPAPADDDYELVFYPAQTGVDPDDEFVYGEPVGVPAGTHVTENGTYTSMAEVALYIHTYGRVPSNFVSKTKARNAGWVAEEGNLQDVLPGMCIGGGGWHNDDQVMPGEDWDQWYECDINYDGGFRGAERLVFSDNGMIFYTPDHYESYARIY